MTGKIVGYLTLLPAVWSVSSQEEADERRLDVDGAPPAVDRRDCVLTYAGRGRASSFAAPSWGAAPPSRHPRGARLLLHSTLAGGGSFVFMLCLCAGVCETGDLSGVCKHPCQ